MTGPLRIVFEPGEIANEPTLLSVVIAARNAGRTIDDQLRALSFQRFDGAWEVVVVDNGSTDDTRARVLGWVGRLPGLRVVDAFDRANIAYARNIGVRSARGERIVMCDADDVVAPGWHAALADALEDNPLVVGALERSRLLPARVDTGRGLDTAAPSFPDDHGHRVLTCNVGFHRSVFDLAEGFDDSLRRGSDQDFGWRVAEAGVHPHFVAEAILYFGSAWRPADVVRKAFADGQCRPALYLRHRGTGMGRPSRAQVVARYRDLLRGPRSEAWSQQGRNGWLYGVAHSAGRVVGSLRQRVMFL